MLVKQENIKRNSLLIRVLVWIFSLFMSAIISVAIVYAIVFFVQKKYEGLHPQIVGEDDMALGMTVVSWFFISSAFAIPFFCFSFIRVKNFIFKLLNRR